MKPRAARRTAAAASLPPAPSPTASPDARTRDYLDACARLGLSPAMNPLIVVSRGGAEAYRASPRATDELAARHQLRREIVHGPQVLTSGTQRLVYAVCRATHPDGSAATAAITVPFVDGDSLMTCETRAKRLATLRVLKLDDLAEPERDTIPAGFTAIDPIDLGMPTEPVATHPAREEPMRTHAVTTLPTREEPIATVATRDVPFVTDATAMKHSSAWTDVPQALHHEPVARVLFDPARSGTSPAAVSSAAHTDATDAREPDPLTLFYIAVAQITRADEAVDTWLAHRAAIAPLPPPERTAAWSALCARTALVSGIADAKGYLKQEIAARTGAKSGEREGG